MLEKFSSKTAQKTEFAHGQTCWRAKVLVAGVAVSNWRFTGATGIRRHCDIQDQSCETQRRSPSSINRIFVDSRPAAPISSLGKYVPTRSTRPSAALCSGTTLSFTEHRAPRFGAIDNMHAITTCIGEASRRPTPYRERITSPFTTQEIVAARPRLLGFWSPFSSAAHFEARFSA